MHVDGIFSTIASIATRAASTVAKATPQIVRALPAVTEAYVAYKATQQTPPLAPVDAMTGASPYYPQAPQYAQPPVYYQPPQVAQPAQSVSSLLQANVAGVPVIPVAAAALVVFLLMRR